MIKVRLSEDALQDLNDGFLFYEAQERTWRLLRDFEVRWTEQPTHLAADVDYEFRCSCFQSKLALSSLSVISALVA